MHYHNRLFIAAAVFAAAITLGISWPCAAQLTPTNLNPANGNASRAVDINSSGQSVGVCYLCDGWDESGNPINGITRGVMWGSTGAMTVLDADGVFFESFGVAINDSGLVTGNWWDSGEGGAFIWDEVNGIVDMGALYHPDPNNPGTLVRDVGPFPVAINADGWVIGMSEYEVTWGSVGCSWLYRNGTMEEITGANGERAFVTAINDSGQILCDISGVIDEGMEDPYAPAIIWEKPVDADTPTVTILTPGQNSAGQAINNSGQAVIEVWEHQDFYLWADAALTRLMITGDPVEVGVDELGFPVYEYPRYYGGWGNVAGIDDAGRIYGTATLPPEPGGSWTYYLWMWQDDVVTDIEVPGHVEADERPANINNSGQMASTCFAPGPSGDPWDTVPTAFVWNLGDPEIQVLSGLGGTSSWGRDLNDAGQVVGFSTLTEDWRWYACVWGAPPAPPSALDITDVTLMPRNPKVISVCVLISNPNDETAYDVTVTAASLNGSETNSRVPLVYGAIKPGDSKKCMLQFKDVPSGEQTLTVEGTSSLGDFSTEQTVTVP